MRSPARACSLLAVAALVLVALPLSALAQSATGEADRLEPPTLLGASVRAADGTILVPPSAASPIPVLRVPAAAGANQPATDPDEAVPLPVPMDPNAGEKPDAGGPDKPDARRKHGVIDQYPQNPRCYVAGHYVPAPPTCPN